MKNLYKAIKITISKNWIVIVALLIIICILFYLQFEQLLGGFLGVLLTFSLQECVYIHRKLSENSFYVEHLINMNKQLAITILDNYFIENFSENSMEYELKFKKSYDFKDIPKLKDYFNIPQKNFFFERQNLSYMKELIKNYYKLINEEGVSKEYLSALVNIEKELVRNIKPKVWIGDYNDEEITNNILQSLCFIAKYVFV